MVRNPPPQLSLLIIAVCLSCLTILSVALYFQVPNLIQMYNNPSTPIIQEPHACTLEAKLCPDGSAVGRSGPNCEFAPCPTESSSATPFTTPSTTPTQPLATPMTNITVVNPQPRQLVSLPLTITGLARTFEANVMMRVENEQGQTLYQTFTTALAPDAGQFGPYAFVLSRDIPTLAELKPQTLTIVVFESSAKDGSEINVVKVPVKLQ